MKRLRTGLLIASLAVLASSRSVHAATLKIGDPAPPLKFDRWVKGKALQSFKLGQTYVVEFWATWCGPCRATMPLLSNIASNYKGRVSVIGMSIWENEGGGDIDGRAKVAAFVKTAGDNMEYLIATDTADGHMASAWMKAAGRDGIPSSFLVDRYGRVAWIGSPEEGLSAALERVLSPQWTENSYEGLSKALAEEEDARKVIIDLAAKRERPEVTLEKLDEFEANYPHSMGLLRQLKFLILLRLDPPKSTAYARSLLKDSNFVDARVLNAMAWNILDAKNLPNRDFVLAKDLAGRASALSRHRDCEVLDILAWAQFMTGDRRTAIKTQERALRVAKDSQASSAVIEEIAKRLDQFRAEKD